MAAFMREFEHLRIPLEIIKSATNNFGDHNFIAEGGYGKVYRGEFRRAEGKTMGAVKRWSLSNEEGDPEFRREIMLLSDNKHENLISLLGFCYEENERVLVYEYASNKSLDFHLQDPTLTWIQRLKICLGAARGLEYLHNPRRAQRVLHCDIKSANILLDENWNAKIADFGLSKYGPANNNRSYLITQAKGTHGYCDPVFSETMIYTKESDVVLFEVLCSRLCFDFGYNDIRRSLPLLVKNSSRKKIGDTIVEVNLRQQMAENSFDTFVAVAHQCLKGEQKQRPSMDLIVRKLEIALKHQEQSIVNLESSSTTYVEEVKRDLVAQKEEDSKNIVFQESDANLDGLINKWSSGKEGNIRALFLTLENIIGSESGWITPSLSVTDGPRFITQLYEKAAYICQPDTLQKRGASIRDKYICGKVRQILKVAFEIFESDYKDYQRRALGENYNDIVKTWYSGKEGDLHALLSTLHNILGAESGWKQVSVTKTMSTFDHVKRLYELAHHVLRDSDDIRTTELNKCGLLHDNLEAAYKRFVSEERDQRRNLGNLYDDDIRSWSHGKERDLGYLLSKLQDILGHESGWEPFSLDGDQWTSRYLGDAYRKSLLLTDPKTLIERGASVKEKYIYGEVRKMLKAAWDCAPAEQKWRNR